MSLASAQSQAHASLASAKLSPLGNKAVLGHFEQTLILAALICGPEATANAIRDKVETQIGKRALTSVLCTLDRLADKGFLESEVEDQPSKRRGGRRRRLYKVTASGEENARRSFLIQQDLAIQAGLIRVA